MNITPALFPEIIAAASTAIAAEADAVTELDQALGDGDHVFNLQRGLQALAAVSGEIAGMDWTAAWQKIGMTVMAAVGGASGSLYATLFIAIGKHCRDGGNFADAFIAGVEAMKQRGKADVGEKTMLDVLIPVAQALQQDNREGKNLQQTLEHLCAVAEIGVESTRDMLATKGRASFLGERSKGQIDAGAKTAQLMIKAIARIIASVNS